jgi:hypothetical protein
VSIYEIRVKGRLDAHWSAWFEGLTLTYDRDTTVLRGSLIDEAALHGVLSKVAGLNLHLLSVNVVEADEVTSAPTADGTAAIGRTLPPSEAPPGRPGAGAATPKKHDRTQRKHRRKRPSR